MEQWSESLDDKHSTKESYQCCLDCMNWKAMLLFAFSALKRCFGSKMGLIAELPSLICRSKASFSVKWNNFFCNWKIKLLKCQPIWLRHKFFQSSYSGVKHWAGRMKESGQELGGSKKRWNFWRYKCVGTTNQFRWIHSNNTSQKQELQTPKLA